MLAIADWLILAWQLIDTTLWLVVFVPLVAIIVFWVGQAVYAYRRALALGGAPGGEVQLALFLPLVLAAFTGFWLVGGRHSSPAATVEAYMEAWESNRPDLAVALFPDITHSYDSQYLAALWASDLDRVTTLIDQNRTIYGPSSGLNPEHPFLSLRVEQTPQLVTFAGPGPRRVRPAFEVEVVRSEQFQTTLLGLIPTTGQRTVVVATVLYMELDEEASPAGTWLPSATWKISAFNDFYPQTP